MLRRSSPRWGARAVVVAIAALLLVVPAVLTAVRLGGPVRAVDNGPAPSVDNPIVTENQQPGDPSVGNPIVIENQQPGDPGWQFVGPSADDTSNQIKGYASATSLNKGERLTFYVTVNPAQTFTLDIYRLGWYGGVGGRLMRHVGPLNGLRQAACPMDPDGMVACSWSPSYTLAVPTGWTTGAYVAMLTNAQGYQNEVPFVVRDDSRVGALLYQQPVNTYQAYNNWGGKSLYDYNSSGGERAHKVSFDRPYVDDGSGDLLNWEVYMIHWLEKSGYDVSYSTSLDTHARGRRLLSAKGFLSVGHDEYWSNAMFDALEAARDAGVSLGFFGGDTGSVQVRFEPSASGAADRVLVCYKDASLDPITDPTLKTVAWREPPLNRPPQMLVGVQFTSQTGNTYEQTVPYVVTTSGHWAYAGTGLKEGERVAGIVGYETDRQYADYTQPNAITGTAALLARSPYTSVGGQSDYQNTSIYQAPSGAWVFGAGTMGWSYALDRAGYVDARIQRVTANVLDTFVNPVDKDSA